MDSYVFGSFSGGMTRFLLLVGSGVIGGAVLFGLCAYPAWRRPELRLFKTLRLLGLVMGVCVAATVVTLAYLFTWTAFYRVDIEKETVYLQYHVPDRTVRIPRASITIVGYQGTDQHGRVVLRTIGGKSYRSAAADSEVLRHNGEALKAIVP